jgi:hypothetical protein
VILAALLLSAAQVVLEDDVKIDLTADDAAGGQA